jgi:hypothetical protein
VVVAVIGQNMTLAHDPEKVVGVDNRLLGSFLIWLFTLEKLEEIRKKGT